MSSVNVSKIINVWETSKILKMNAFNKPEIHMLEWDDIPHSLEEYLCTSRWI